MSSLAGQMIYQSQPWAEGTCKFPFLQLPGELRNKIYRLLLKNTRNIPRGAYRSSHNNLTKLSICATILRVSRQIYQEAIPYLYTLNRFNAHPSYLKKMPFIADSSRPVFSSTCSAMITRFYIAVRLDNDPNWTGKDLAIAFSGVEELEVEAWQPSYGITGIDNLKGFAEVRGVGKAKVHGCGMPTGFSEWLENVMQSPEGTPVPEWQSDDWNTWTDGNK